MKESDHYDMWPSKETQKQWMVNPISESFMNLKMVKKARKCWNKYYPFQFQANLARWEPAHGRFKFRHPWKQYLRVGALMRNCAYCIETLNGFISSEVQLSRSSLLEEKKANKDHLLKLRCKDKKGYISSATTPATAAKPVQLQNIEALEPIQPGGLMSPSYVNTPLLSFIERGSAVHGVILPGCPETYESSQVENLNKGDVVAIPAGATHWIYNDGQEELVAVVLFDAQNKDNLLLSSFYMWKWATKMSESLLQIILESQEMLQKKNLINNGLFLKMHKCHWPSHDVIFLFVRLLERDITATHIVVGNNFDDIVLDESEDVLLEVLVKANTYSVSWDFMVNSNALCRFMHHGVGIAKL
ncbi:11S globulin seed storage protein G3-like protein [Tanacetum coccineum]